MKKIDEFPDYTIHRDGRIYNRHGKLMKMTVANNNYLMASLCVDKKQKKRLLHRLLAIAFIPNPNNHPFVCHYNDIRTDNRLDNLYWGTSSDNMHDRYNNGYVSVRRKAVFQYSKDGDFIAKHVSTYHAASVIGRTNASISSSIARNGYCGGYKWSYKLIN